MAAVFLQGRRVFQRCSFFGLTWPLIRTWLAVSTKPWASPLLEAGNGSCSEPCSAMSQAGLATIDSAQLLLNVYCPRVESLSVACNFSPVIQRCLTPSSRALCLLCLLVAPIPVSCHADCIASQSCLAPATLRNLFFRPPLFCESPPWELLLHTSSIPLSASCQHLSQINIQNFGSFSESNFLAIRH